uniref:Fes1 domain-containing protein n=1 Tax=Syphacia muris TaxID=451379 RepID=A0A158R505_9BILA
MEAKTGEDEEEKHKSAIDWDSLLNATEDPELQEILRTPIEEAIHVLKNGREIQKLSLIRNLNELIDTEGNEAVTQVLPLIQKVLEEESSDLDVHCEAAVTYKNLIQNKKLLERFE